MHEARRLDLAALRPARLRGGVPGEHVEMRVGRRGRNEAAEEQRRRDRACVRAAGNVVHVGDL